MNFRLTIILLLLSITSFAQIKTDGVRIFLDVSDSAHPVLKYYNPRTGNQAIGGSGSVDLSPYALKARTITVNGTTHDLATDATFTVTATGSDIYTGTTVQIRALTTAYKLYFNTTNNTLYEQNLNPRSGITDNGGSDILTNTDVWLSPVNVSEVDARWFGLKGDGTTDNTTAFNNMIAAGVKNIAFYDGVYKGKFVISNSDYNITFKNATLKGRSGDTYCFAIDGGSGYSINNKIEGLRMDMSAMSTGAYGLYMHNTYQNSINHTLILNEPSSGNAVKLATGVYTTQFNTIEATQGGLDIHGVDMGDAVTTITFSNAAFWHIKIAQALAITFINPVLQGTLTKVRLDTCRTIQLYGGDIEGTGTYLSIGNAVTHLVSQYNDLGGFTGTYISGAAQPMVLEDLHQKTVRNTSAGASFGNEGYSNSFTIGSGGKVAINDTSYPARFNVVSKVNGEIVSQLRDDFHNKNFRVSQSDTTLVLSSREGSDNSIIPLTIASKINAESDIVSKSSIYAKDEVKASGTSGNKKVTAENTSANTNISLFAGGSSGVTTNADLDIMDNDFTNLRYRFRRDGYIKLYKKPLIGTASIDSPVVWSHSDSLLHTVAPYASKSYVDSLYGGGSTNYVDTIYNNGTVDSLIYTVAGRRHAIKYPSGGISTETDPTVHATIKAIPTSADASTNKYLNWNGSAYTRKQVDYFDLTNRPTGSGWNGGLEGTSLFTESATVTNQAVQYTFTGSSQGTLTLPTRNSFILRGLWVKNIGSANLIILGDIYTTSVVSSMTLAPGESVCLTTGANGISTGTGVWNALFNSSGGVTMQQVKDTASKIVHDSLTAANIYFDPLVFKGLHTDEHDATWLAANPVGSVNNPVTLIGSSSGGGGVLEDLIFSTEVGLTNSSGVWTAASGTAGTYNNYGLATKKLSAGQDGYIQWQYAATDGQDAMLTFKTSNTNEGYAAGNYKAAAWISSSGATVYQIDNGGSATATTATGVIGNYYRIDRTGSTLTLKTSAVEDFSSGVTTIYTYTFSSSADLYININVDASKKSYHPKGYNLQ
jgi:hypothetical protein